MTEHNISEKNDYVRALTHRYEKAGIAHPDRLALATFEGFSSGDQKMKDARESLRFSRFFDDHEAGHADYSLFHLTAKRYLRNLPGLLEDMCLDEEAARIRLIVDDDGDLTAAIQRILRESASGLNGVRDALIRYHRDRAAELLGEHAVDPLYIHFPDNEYAAGDCEPYRSFSSDDHAAANMARAADYLIVGMRAGVIPVNSFESAAFDLGYASGAAQEALRQAASAFDHDAYKEAGIGSAEDWHFAVAGELAIIVSILVACWREAKLGLDIAQLLTTAQMLSIGVPAVAAGLASFAVMAALILWCTSPHLEKKHTLIADEAAKRVYQLYTNHPPRRPIAALPQDEERGKDDDPDDDDDIDDDDGSSFIVRSFVKDDGDDNAHDRRETER